MERQGAARGKAALPRVLRQYERIHRGWRGRWEDRHFPEGHCNHLWDPSLRFPGIQELPGGPKRFNVTHSLPEKTDNPTVFPSALLESWTPIFLIRHPVLVFPSYCRALIRLFGGPIPDNDAARARFWDRAEGAMSFSETRELYDWYTDHYDAYGEENNAILLDSNDVILHPNIALKVAEATGLDKSKVQQTWSLKENMDPLQQAFLQTLQNSTGIQKDKALQHIDSVKEAEKWKVEFGEAGGALIARCVEAAMPDYEYLRTKRTWVD